MGQIKVFTLQEANELIEDLTPRLHDLREKREEILKQEIEIDALELVTDRKGSSGTPELRKKLDAYNRLVNLFYELVDQLHDTGCLLKDIEQGLIDFYHLYHGRMVFLCWKLGEPEVHYWHEVGRGFGTRKPLEP